MTAAPALEHPQPPHLTVVPDPPEPRRRLAFALPTTFAGHDRMHDAIRRTDSRGSQLLAPAVVRAVAENA